MMDKLYLVTGGSGHLGNSLIRELRSRGLRVRALIQKQDDDQLLKSLDCEIVKGDIRDLDTLELLFKHHDEVLYVIHTAGIISIASKKNQILYDVNINGTKNMCTLALKYHVHRFIYISSVHAIPEKEIGQAIREVDDFNPDLVIDDYAKSKAIASQHVLDQVKLGLNAILVHPSGIIGPYDYGKTHMTMMIEDYMNGMLTSRVKGAYDFVDVRDVAIGVYQALERGRVGQCYILSGQRIDLAYMFETLRKLSGRKYRIHVLPLWFAKLSAPLAEIYYRIRKLPPIYTKYSLHTLQSNSSFDHQKATNELGYATRPIESTLSDTVYFLRELKRIKRKRVLTWMKKYETIKL